MGLLSIIVEFNSAKVIQPSGDLEDVKEYILAMVIDL